MIIKHINKRTKDIEFNTIKAISSDLFIALLKQHIPTQQQHIPIF